LKAWLVALNVAGAALERLDATSNPKGAVMHVGVVGEIPDLIAWPTEETSAAEQIVDGSVGLSAVDRAKCAGGGHLSYVREPWRKLKGENRIPSI
jgi:hypothetical protein